MCILKWRQYQARVKKLNRSLFQEHKKCCLSQVKQVYSKYGKISYLKFDFFGGPSNHKPCNVNAKTSALGFVEEDVELLLESSYHKVIITP